MIEKKKVILFIVLVLLPGIVYAQTSIADSSFRYFLEAGRIQAEINNAEKEVKVYSKEIKQNKRLQNRMKDKEGRLKYRVARQLAKMDTTSGHKRTYTEWQLVKTRKSLDQANLHIAKAEQAREEKILLLADKTKEFDTAIMKGTMAMANQRIASARIDEKDTKVKAGPQKKVKARQNHWR